MPSDKLKEIAAYKAKIATLEKEVAVEQKKKLANLHKEVGMASTEELIDALKGLKKAPRKAAAKSKGRKRRAKNNPGFERRWDKAGQFMSPSRHPHQKGQCRKIKGQCRHHLKAFNSVVITANHEAQHQRQRRGYPARCKRLPKDNHI